MWRVLVVDDDQGIRELLRVVLEMEGYQVMTANDGAQALDLLAATDEPWLVLMDVMMPRLGGLEVCRRLRERGATGGRHRVALMTAGFLGDSECPPPARTILRKPFDVDAVVRLIATLAASGGEPVSFAPTSGLGVEGGCLAG
ncbi:MAG TPA: response regulator [Ktedonobacterales bacterium]